MFMPAFQKGWNGRKHFLNNKLVFPRGLLDRVIKILDRYNINYNIINNDNIIKNESNDISKKLKEIKNCFILILLLISIDVFCQ